MADPLDFGLGTELPPLDLGEALGPTVVPPSAPSPRQQAKDFAPLLALLPIAMAKGGRVGVAALLQGFQQARERRRTEGRQESQDQQRALQIQQQEKFRRDQLQQQRELADAQRRQQFTQSFTTGLDRLDTPEAVRAYLSLMGPQAQTLGLNPARLEGFALEQMTPTRLQKKEATRVLDEATKTYKENAPQHVYTLSDGTQADWAELNRRAGVTVSATPAAPEAPALEANTPEKLYLVAFAKERGKTPEQLTPKELEQARKNFMQSDDRPQPQATILIQTVDANGNPVQQLVPRTPGSTFAPAPSSAQQTSMAEQETSLAIIGDIERLYRPEFIGPAVGRVTKAQMAIPGAPDVTPEVAEFYSAVSSLRNEIIKLMSGAAVSGSEELRMKEQIPDVTDKPSAFVAKLNQTRRNREMLLSRIQARSGQGGAAKPPTTVAPRATPPKNPFRRSP